MGTDDGNGNHSAWMEEVKKRKLGGDTNAEIKEICVAVYFVYFKKGSIL